MNNSQSVLECRDVSVSFSEPGLSVNVLQGISLRIDRGQSLSIVGDLSNALTRYVCPFHVFSWRSLPP